MQILIGFFQALGVAVFLYLLWRGMRDSYDEKKLITYGWLVMLSFLVGSRIVFGLFNWGVLNDNLIDWLALSAKPGLNYFGGYVGVVLMTFWISKVNSWKIWPLADDGMGYFIFWLIYMFLIEFFRLGFSWKMGALMMVLLVAYLGGILIKRKYRSFVWYRSGKKGFVFLFVNFLAFLLLSVVSLSFKEGVVHYLSYLIISLISLVGLFILGDVLGFLMINQKGKKT